jgi:hypothetical protein
LHRPRKTREVTPASDTREEPSVTNTRAERFTALDEQLETALRTAGDHPTA